MSAKCRPSSHGLNAVNWTSILLISSWLSFDIDTNRADIVYTILTFPRSKLIFHSCHLIHTVWLNKRDQMLLFMMCVFFTHHIRYKYCCLFDEDIYDYIMYIYIYVYWMHSKVLSIIQTSWESQNPSWADHDYSVRKAICHIYIYTLVTHPCLGG